MGPLSPAMKQELVEQQADIKYPAAWNTLREYLDWLQHRGVTPNVGSFIGAATPRVYVLGRENRGPSPAELQQMLTVTRKAMDDGAFGCRFGPSSTLPAPTRRPTS